MRMATNRQDAPPVSCICALCNCGAHRCSACLSGRFVDARGEDSPPDPIARGPSPTIGELPTGRRSSSSTSSSASTSSFELEGDSEWYTCKQRSGEMSHCQCLPNERYLPGKTGDVRPANKDHQSQEQEELLHVLVTRPEVASRPRDNIIFEGDMDLKTTFETSYEALAKMRLDHWKRYQEQKLLGSEQPLKQQLRSSKPARDLKRGHKHRGVSDSKLIEGAPGGGAELGDVAGDKRGPKRAGVCEQHPEVEPSSGLLTSEREKVKFKEEEESRQKDGEHAPLDKPTHLSSSSAHCEPPLAPVNISRQTQCSSADIDQDLLSILVYDANMNRLEKMRVRKRSKYRPSTSLRSGAAGLFGDDGPREAQQEAPVGCGSGSGMGCGQRGMRASQSPAELQQASKSSSSSGANDSRNLNHFNQPNQLTFSEQNLPVSCKRKFKDNVNMRDHIREQNIMGDNGCSCIKSALPKVPANGEGPDETALREELQDLRLAQKEEADAVRELQRLINTPFEQNISLPNTQSALGNPGSQANIQQPCSSV